ncbi:MAG TPA: hypothetical protein VD902_09300, partial [Symbiobacteriaceae bacterium]|nr:hypothetical protein [Symbiobacteriaceae bacterium]
MFDAPSTKVAVALITESTQPGRAPAGLRGYCLISGAGPGARVTVYLEQGPASACTLEGPLVWLEPGSAVDAEAKAGVAPEAVAVAGLAAELELELELEPDRDPESEPQAGPGPEAGAEPGAGPGPVLSPEPDEGPAEVGFKLYPEPATPVAVASPPATLTVTMAGRHPMAPRAGGSAQLDLKDGRVSLALRSLPSPAALGRDPATGRPYNAYRAWLVGQRSGTRHDLGLISRVWGDNFRLQSATGLPLQRFD